MSLNQGVNYKKSSFRGLYVITDEHLGHHVSITKAALEGGASIIQLRDKSTPSRQLLEIGKSIRSLTADAGALFIVNDKVDLALIAGADGVHLGPDDWPVAEVRRIVDERFIIGASCGTPDEAMRAEAEGANYIGIGAVFATATKGDAGAPIGIEGLKAVMEASRLPKAAIGGVNATNIQLPIEAGADMACVVSAVAAAGDYGAMVRATRELCQKIQSAR